MRNKEIVKNTLLLDGNGNLKQKGFAKSLILDYKKDMIKTKKSRIKEWDYYLVYNKEIALCFTIDDNTYMGLTSVSVIDFKNKKEKTTSLIKFFTGGKTNLPESSKEGDVEVKNKKISIAFFNDGKTRNIKVTMPKFYKDMKFSCDLTLTEEPNESLVIVTPFEKDKHFYYNQKIIGMVAEGIFTIGDKKFQFDKQDTRALLDWGRGVWTYKNTWYWGALCANVDGHEVGFNIGYGFGDTTQASENAIFYDGVMHKLDDVVFNIPKNQKGKDDFLSDWTFTSSDGRFEMDFKPIIDRAADTNVLILRSNQHQVFGLFTGYFILDDGTKVEIKNEIGFAEKVFNKW